MSTAAPFGKANRVAAAAQDKFDHAATKAGERFGDRRMSAFGDGRRRIEQTVARALRKAREGPSECALIHWIERVFFVAAPTVINLSHMSSTPPPTRIVSCPPHRL